MFGIVQPRSKSISSRTFRRSGIRRLLAQDENQEWIILIAFICVDGSHLDPSLIYQNQSESLQHSWLQGFGSDVHHIWVGDFHLPVIDRTTGLGFNGFNGFNGLNGCLTATPSPKPKFESFAGCCLWIGTGLISQCILFVPIMGAKDYKQ